MWLHPPESSSGGSDVARVAVIARTKGRKLPISMALDCERNTDRINTLKLLIWTGLSRYDDVDDEDDDALWV